MSRPVWPVRNRSRSIGERIDPREKIPAAAQQLRAERCQLDGSWATGAVEHLLADRPLERGDLLADRRLGVAEPLGGPGERALGGDRIERQQVPEVEVAPRRHEHKLN